MPLPASVDLDDAALALLRDRAPARRAEALLELVRFQRVPLTSTEVDLLNALLAIGQLARTVEA